MDASPAELTALEAAAGRGPLELLRTLFAYPYCNLLSAYFDRTREFELGLLFIGRAYEVLDAAAGELSPGEYERLDYRLQTMRLSLYDRLNHWGEYLDLFEELLRSKRTGPWVGLYEPRCEPARFGRYYLGRALDGYLQVHELYLYDDRRRLIERKAWRQATGKNVDYLKCRQKEDLTKEERATRYSELERLLAWMQKTAATEGR